MDPESCLTNLERAAISILLQKGAQQLAIVQTGATTSNFCSRPLMQRIRECDSSKMYGREMSEASDLHYKLLEPSTLNAIRYFTESALEGLRTEILNYGTIQSIQEILELEHRCRDEAMQLVHESLRYSNEVVDTENRIKDISIKTCEEIKEKEIKLAILQDELLDLQYHKEVSSIFVEQRMEAKLSQVSLWLQEHEHSLSQSIDFNVVACDLQDRVHVEILNFLHCVIQDLKGLVQSWEDRSREEMADMNVRLDGLQQARCEQNLQLQTLTSLFKKHSDDIKAYLEERKAREHKQEMQQHVNEMATKIQAWWRGTMVRRHLGPYKVDKKKKPKEKPKKKK